jgi:hypothetical protein
MPKKTTKVKIVKKAKLFIVPVPKPEAPNAIENIVGALASLQCSEGWAILVKILNDNIAYLERAILDKVDPLSKAPLTDIEVELLRTKRNLNIELRDTPSNYSKLVVDTGEVPEDFDPFFHTKDEIDKANRQPREE